MIFFQLKHSEMDVSQDILMKKADKFISGQKCKIYYHTDPVLRTSTSEYSEGSFFNPLATANSPLATANKSWFEFQIFKIVFKIVFLTSVKKR